MKYLFISLFLLLSYTVFGKYDPKPLLEYMKNDPIPLNYDVKEQKYNISDFSKAITPTLNNQVSYTVNSEATVPFSTDYWYIQDFASDPFNGMIEVYEVGEPLPSVPLTVFIASILVFTVLKYNKLHKKGNVAYEY